MYCDDTNETHLHRCAFSRQSREADDVAEVDGDFVVKFRHNRLSADQLFSHRPIQQINCVTTIVRTATIKVNLTVNFSKINLIVNFDWNDRWRR